MCVGIVSLFATPPFTLTFCVTTVHRVSCRQQDSVPTLCITHNIDNNNASLTLTDWLWLLPQSVPISQPSVLQISWSHIVSHSSKILWLQHSVQSYHLAINIATNHTLCTCGVHCCWPSHSHRHCCHSTKSHCDSNTQCWQTTLTDNDHQIANFNAHKIVCVNILCISATSRSTVKFSVVIVNVVSCHHHHSVSTLCIGSVNRTDNVSCCHAISGGPYHSVFQSFRCPVSLSQTLLLRSENFGHTPIVCRVCVWPWTLPPTIHCVLVKIIPVDRLIVIVNAVTPWFLIVNRTRNVDRHRSQTLIINLQILMSTTLCVQS